MSYYLNREILQHFETEGVVHYEAARERMYA
eukprot:COSAG04_NODE_2143_length_4696_cov_2.321242_4_plen_31_part_00